jgi:hypothetical protein
MPLKLAPAEPDETILRAAIQADGNVYHLLPPARHHNVLHFFKLGTKLHDQGFLTSRGRYVDREEALKIATAAGQLNGLREKPGSYRGPELFSEDLW